MRMNDLDSAMAEGKIGDFLNWGIGKLSKNAPPPRVEPVLKPKIRMVDGKPMEVKPDGTVVPYKAPEAPKVDTPAPKVEPEVPPVDKKPGIVSKTADFAKKHPYIAGTAGITASGAVRNALDDETTGVIDAAGQNVGDVAGAGIEFLKGMKKGYTDKPSKPVEPKPETTPANTNATAPDQDPDYIPPASQETKESILQILKLSGQKPITERDNIMGIIKPKTIQTLTESADLNECGMAPMGGSQPASLSINATAGSGDEVAGMLKAIMQLAGVGPVSQDMMPQNDNIHMPMVKALQILGGDEPMEPSEPDSMNSGVDYPADAGDDVSVAHGDIDNDGDHDMDDHEAEGDGTVTVRNVDTGEEFSGKDVTQPGKITVRNVDTGEEFSGTEKTEEYSNSPADATDVPEWDPEKMVFRPNQASQGDRMDGTMPKGVPTMESTEDHVSSLFKAYEAFKNGQ